MKMFQCKKFLFIGPNFLWKYFEAFGIHKLITRVFMFIENKQGCHMMGN